MSRPAATSSQPSTASHTHSMMRAFWQMSGWKKALLVLSILAFLVGAAGSVIAATRPAPVEVQQQKATIESLQVPAGQQLTPNQQAQLDQAKAKVSELSHWFYDKTAPHLWRMGLSFFVMFVLGFMARTFVKTVAFFLAAILSIATAASYFGYIELGQFRENLTQSTGWAMDQLKGLRDLVLTFIGASMSGTIGFIVGFLRR